jgi:hypothetical protein
LPNDLLYHRIVIYGKMKRVLTFACMLFLAISCLDTHRNEQETGIEGTWKLISGTIIEKGDTIVTDYTGDQSMIKIINATHFSFLNHDLKKGTDSAAVFAAGGGRYTLSGDQYTEYLEYCSYREWEGNTFPFTVTINGDTLIQKGVEKIENLGVERLNIERYQRVMPR